ncbi:amino acid permease/ SLC12A domain-containing protein [Leucosporidium creatinivorum]|uniref:Amino acid permease/ SLC12A domain-containing protein n=1 Tax=Leucosporidium creatinivorum TaxID=106004 RepID=A0A1Y2F642_9BASI|nr:amino acid permease/ SLC12A domain-containing protein [Leucosporidium creatinivorum]
MSDTYPDVEKQQANSGEKHTGQATVLHGLDASAADGTVHRNLKSRHLQMIALGGTIGTGLFVGAGGALATGGPLGILLGYTIMGCVVYSMMIALGEMCTLYPVSGAFTHYTARFADPALGFALGWNYWYSYAITLPTEITAAALVIEFWPGGANINPAVWISIFIVVIVSFNFLGVRAYGEAEFWFSVTKIITILGLILLGIIITAGGAGSPAIGFRYWKNPGPFQQENGIPGTKGRFLAFWTVFVQAAFSFLGTEIVALTAGEAENPRRNVPKAIRRVFYRILFFYVIGVFVMGLIVSPNDEGLLNNSGSSASPWVIAIRNAGIPALPSIVNAVVLISAFSAGNSDLYASSRTLYGLACDGKAPAIFRKCTKNGLPIYCLAITAAFSFLAYMNVSNSASTVFNYLSSLSSITGLITWGCINFSFLRFYYGCKKQGIDRREFPYVAPFQPYASYFGLVLIILVIFFNGYTLFLDGQWDTVTFVIDYITVVIFIVLYAFWKFWKRTKFVRLSSMDFITGRRELDEISEQEEANQHVPKNIWEKVWAAVM